MEDHEAVDFAEQLIRSSDAAIIAESLDGIVTFWNPAAERIFGYTAEEMTGQAIDRIAAPDRPREMAEIMELIGRGERIQEHETLRRRKDGSLVRVLLTVTPVYDRQGRVVGATKIARDITERRDTEARLRTILDTAPDAIIAIDPAGKILSFSQAAEAMFGYSAVAVIGRNVSMLMAEPHASAHDGYLAHFLDTGERRVIGIGREVEARRADGTIFPIELAVGEVRLPETRMFTGFIRDISRRKRLEAELAQAQKMEAVGQLTGGLAHDFNNLLSVVAGNLEMLESHIGEGPDPAEAAELLGEARAATERGAELAARLLAFGRRQALRPAPTDINALVSGMVVLLRRSLGSAITVETRLAANLPWTLVDPGQVETVLLNLSLNARDAMPDGGQVLIETRALRIEPDIALLHGVTEPGDYLVLSVTDTGSGMDEETLARAFEPFFTTKPVGAGSGLGLSMVYGFAKQSGGSVHIYSEPGVGTTVRLFLPTLTRPERAARQAPKIDSARPPFAGTILVVEDDAAVRRIAIRRLARLGFDTIELDNGSTALVALRANPEIALLFSDVVLADSISGIDLALAARGSRPDLPGPADLGLYGSGDVEGKRHARRRAVAAKALY